MRKVFTKKFLQDRCGCGYIEQKIVDHTRWSVHYEEIFTFEGKYYRTRYSIGATEGQDESPYEYAPEEIECPEVHAVERVVVVYEDI